MTRRKIHLPPKPRREPTPTPVVVAGHVLLLGHRYYHQGNAFKLKTLGNGLRLSRHMFFPHEADIIVGRDGTLHQHGQAIGTVVELGRDPTDFLDTLLGSKVQRDRGRRHRLRLRRAVEALEATK